MGALPRLGRDTSMCTDANIVSRKPTGRISEFATAQPTYEKDSKNHPMSLPEGAMALN